MPISMKQMKQKVEKLHDENSFIEMKPSDANIESASHDIAIIGLACRFAMADSPEEFWNMLVQGTDGIHEYPKVRRKYGDTYLKYQDKFSRSSGYYEGGFLNEVDEFDNEVFPINHLEVSLMSPEQRNFLAIAWQAAEDAGYGGDRTRGSDVGVFVGNSVDFGVPYKEFIDVLNPELSSTSISGNLNSIIASRISFLNDWKGPAMDLDTACSSSLTAIHYACMSLRTGECSMAVAGSAKIDNLPLKEIKRKEDILGITSEDGRTRTFDLNSNGTGLGEGVGAIVLKRLSQAQKDGDQIYAVIKGSAVNQDGQSANLTAPNPVAQAEVIVRAWKDAKIKPETVSYIEAHGTATKLGDPIEIAGITQAFRKFTEKKQFCAIGSVKSNIGHLDHAAGMAGIIKLILCLEHEKLVPSIHYEAPNQNINFSSSPVYVNTEYKDWKRGEEPRRCGISAFGLSGTNCHIVLEEAPKMEQRRRIKQIKQEYHLLTISASSRERLLDYVWRYEAFLCRHPEVDVCNLCYTANTGREQYPSRLAVIFQTIEELRDKLELAAIRRLENMEQENVYYNTFHVIPEEQKVKQQNDITVTEKKEITEQAAELLNVQSVTKDYMIALAKIFCKGASVSWNLLYHNLSNEAMRIHLPTYPYAKKKFWIEPDEKRVNGGTEENQEEQPVRDIILLGDERFSQDERKMAQIIGKILELNEINIYQNFMELGGNSIVAIKVEMELNKEGYKIKVADLLSEKSIRKLASIQDGKEEAEMPVIEKEISLVTAEEIEGIEPFTEFIFKGCFYSAFIPIAKKYHRNLLHIMANDLMTYGWNQEDDFLSFTVNYRGRKAFDECLEDMGMHCEYKVRSENLINDLMESIGNRKPVILCIDCYYSPMRKDMYQLEHWPHNILVYGVDKEKREFKIIEHKNSESMLYQKEKIGFQELENSYYGYFEEFEHMDIINSNLYDSVYDEKIEFPTYFEFEGVEQEDDIDAEEENQEIRMQQLAFLREQDELLHHSKENMIRFVEELSTRLDQESYIEENCEAIITIMNKLVNRYTVIQYQQKSLYPEQELAGTLVEELTSHWDKVRNLFVKFYYSHSYSATWVNRIKQRLLEVLELENKWYDMIGEVKSDGGRADYAGDDQGASGKTGD